MVCAIHYLLKWPSIVQSEGKKTDFFHKFGQNVTSLDITMLPRPGETEQHRVIGFCGWESKSPSPSLHEDCDREDTEKYKGGGEV